jgi:hypothetical protein
METRHLGRAIVQENDTDLLIVIPTRRNWLGIVLTSLYLIIWLMVLISIVVTLAAGYSLQADNPFSLIWILAWTAGGVFVLRNLLWNVWGKEYIAIDGDTLMIEKKGLLFSRPQQYEIAQVVNLRIESDKGGYVGQFVLSKSLLNTSADGMIRFEYGLKTVKFGGSVGRTEAGSILHRINERGYLSEENFLPGVLLAG